MAPNTDIAVHKNKSIFFSVYSHEKISVAWRPQLKIQWKKRKKKNAMNSIHWAVSKVMQIMPQRKYAQLVIEILVCWRDLASILTNVDRAIINKIAFEKF